MATVPYPALSGMNDERIMLGELAPLAERGVELLALLLLLREKLVLDERLGEGSKASSEWMMPAITAWLAGLLFTRLGESFLPEEETVSRVRVRRR